MLTLRAYLDAGSGSMILQVVVGGFAAAAVSVKLFWRRILTFLHLREPDEDEATSPARATTTETPAVEADAASPPSRS